MSTRIEFARDVLKAGGFPPTLNNYLTFICWFEAEGTKAKFNPLATTRPAKGSTKFNSSNVQNYPSWAVGVKATVDTLNNGNYPLILKSLKMSASAQITLHQVTASPWGTHVDHILSFIDAIRADWSKYAFLSIPH